MSVVLRVDDNIIIDYFLNTRNLLFTRVPSFFIVANLNALKLLHECFFCADFMFENNISSFDSYF